MVWHKFNRRLARRRPREYQYDSSTVSANTSAAEAVTIAAILVATPVSTSEPAIESDGVEHGGNGGGGLGIFRILIPVSVAGWVLCAASCILCINGKGRAGRWVPEWYLDSKGTKRDKALVGFWWLAVLLLWPVILPALLTAKLALKMRKSVRRARGKDLEMRDEGDREQQTEMADRAWT